MEKQRLDKFISNQLIISRSAVRIGIKRGLATVNGEVIRDFSHIINADTDKVIYDKNQVGFKKYVYIIMNKPAGVLSATNDKKKKTVIDLVPEGLKRPDLFPVGRLDKDTTGLLIITDDGVFAHNCISPKKKIPKSYIAELDGELHPDMIEKFRSGIVLADNTVCKEAKLEILQSNKARLTITEGKYHQIKRMFGVVGLGVNSLHRESIGKLQLPKNLDFGKCVEMEEFRIKNLISS